ncbi:hypothetical protein [Cupriavidus sp. SK-3]|uniref:hypothetical protein n=1 Tax=Cupriavidus sp. SK-3 TaxID=1470558 RepID=UPI001F15C54A|nr:hypothetical protein [Cupriavidus sp. SK-3]
MPMRTLAKRFKTKPFDDASTDGFVIDRVRDDFVEARYVERVEYTDKVVDPFGKELAFDRVEFKQCEFRAATTGPGLELMDAPRSTQGLVSRLTEVSDFALAISPLSLDVLAWAGLFQELSGVTGIVDVLQIGALEVERGILAKAVIKGEKDVREASTSLTKGKRYTLEKVQLRLQGAHRGTVLLTNVGAAKIDVDDPGEMVAALRQSLTEMLSA